MTSEDLFSHYIPTIGPAGVLAGLIIGGFRWANHTVASDIRDSVALWILGEPDRSSWSLAAARVFEALYGAVYFSRRALIVNLCVCIAATGYAMFTIQTQDRSDASLEQSVLVGLGLFYVFPVLLFSYLKTRYFSRRLAAAPGTRNAVVVLVIDLFLTALIWTVWLIIVFFAVLFNDKLLGEDETVEILRTLVVLPWLMMGLMDTDEFAIEYSTVLLAPFFPTLLVGLVLGTVGAQKLYISTSSLLGGASKYLSKERIEKEPISLVGEVLAALVFLFVCAYGVFGPRP